MNQNGKRMLSLLLAFIMVLGLFVNVHPNVFAAATLQSDDAVVTGIRITGIADGTEPWDSDHASGNDDRADNKIVQSFDTVTYTFRVDMNSYSGTNYTEARVKLKLVLPLSSEEAEFNQSAMGWIDQTAGYQPVLTTETHNGVSCQVLTCYKHLQLANDEKVVPGFSEQNVTIKVKAAKNGTLLAPTFSAAMEYGTWEGDCSEHNRQEKQSVTAEKVTVSATPRYNIKLSGEATYKRTFDFNTGNATAQKYGDAYHIGQLTGRVNKYGVVLELYNNNSSKGFKGIELPSGPITFGISLSSEYTIAEPNAGYTTGQKVDVSEAYMPRLWSCDGNEWTDYGGTNADGRMLHEAYGHAQNSAPKNRYYSTEGYYDYVCYNGGNWTATQEGKTIHVTVSDYEIRTDRMPTMDADRSSEVGAYGEDKGIGAFSAGEIWIVQPFNKLGSTNTDPNQFDIIKDYGTGNFWTTVRVQNMKATSIGGTELADSDGTNDAQAVKTDDSATVPVQLVLLGSLQNRIFYVDYNDPGHLGVNVTNLRDGFDVAAIGTKFKLRGGFSYAPNGEEDNIFYYGTNLTKFYGSAFEILNEAPGSIYDYGANATLDVYYAAKPDGTDWANDTELFNATEEKLNFYHSIEEIPKGHLCVALLYCFKGPDSTNVSNPYYFGFVSARVRNNPSLVGNTYMLTSCSRVWTKSAFETAGMKLDDIPDWATSETKPTSFLAGGSCQSKPWYYNKTAYHADGSATDHSSDWGHWGDTMLVIGYKAGISQSIAQTVNGGAKSTYSLDAAQRVADFMLRPSPSFDTAGASVPGQTAAVTVVVTLPAYLTYRSGSAYFGGVYEQTSENGGTQGIIQNGVLKEPTVVNNADGTQTLTWVIPDVAIGEPMPLMYYSVDIGDRANPAKDIPTGTHNLATKVRISASGDNRLASFENGNYAESGITIVRGSNSNFDKYAPQDAVESNGIAEYIITYGNTSDNETPMLLLDTMPYNGVNGSTFTGDYTVSGWQLDASRCDVSKLTVYYTTEEAYKEATITSLGVSVKPVHGLQIRLQI